MCGRLESGEIFLSDISNDEYSVGKGSEPESGAKPEPIFGSLSTSLINYFIIHN